MDNSPVELTKSTVFGDSAASAAELNSSNLLSREVYVITNGLGAGLARGLHDSAGDLLQFGSSFAEQPLSTMSDFVKKHWSEAAVAATISFIAPRKLANTVIAAASMRGVAGATYDSIKLAADPNNDIGKVKGFYADSIASETRALVNALPMTIAGGVAGRMGAHAVFGKGMGAWDLAGGQVTLKDVKANFWNLHDKVMPPTTKMLVVDLDGTLVSTNKHLAIGIDKAAVNIAENIGVDKKFIYDSLYEQFNKLHSFTNPWTVELALGEKLKVGKPGGMTVEQFRSKVSDPYWNTIEKTAPEQLNLYDGVKSTFSELSKQGVPVVVFSNSPSSAVLPRMAVHGLENQVSRILALKNMPPPQGLSSELLAEGAKRLESQMNSPGANKLFEVPRDLRKPHPDILQKLMKEENLRPKEVMMVGDSIADDMGIAQNSGARGLWARYSEIDKKYDAATGASFRHVPSKGPLPKFEGELQAFPEILKRLRPEQDIGGIFTSNFQLPRWYTPIQSYGLLGVEHTNQQR